MDYTELFTSVCSWRSKYTGQKSEMQNVEVLLGQNEQLQPLREQRLC